MHHGALGAELLAAEAVDAGLSVDHRQVIPKDNGLGRTDVGTGATADAVGTVDGWMGTDRSLNDGTGETAHETAAAAEQRAKQTNFLGGGTGAGDRGGVSPAERCAWGIAC